MVSDYSSSKLGTDLRGDTRTCSLQAGRLIDWHRFGRNTQTVKTYLVFGLVSQPKENFQLFPGWPKKVNLDAHATLWGRLQKTRELMGKKFAQKCVITLVSSDLLRQTLGKFVFLGKVANSQRWLRYSETPCEATMAICSARSLAKLRVNIQTVAFKLPSFEISSPSCVCLAFSEISVKMLDTFGKQTYKKIEYMTP